MPAPSICFRTLRLLLGYIGSFKSVHELKCILTQTRPRFNDLTEARGANLTSITQLPIPALPKPGFEPGTVGMGSQRLTTRPPRLLFEHVSATVFMFKSLRQPILLRLL